MSNWFDRFVEKWVGDTLHKKPMILDPLEIIKKEPRVIKHGALIDVRSIKMRHWMLLGALGALGGARKAIDEVKQIF